MAYNTYHHATLITLYHRSQKRRRSPPALENEPRPAHPEAAVMMVRPEASPLALAAPARPRALARPPPGRVALLSLEVGIDARAQLLRVAPHRRLGLIRRLPRGLCDEAWGGAQTEESQPFGTELQRSASGVSGGRYLVVAVGATLQRRSRVRRDERRTNSMAVCDRPITEPSCKHVVALGLADRRRERRVVEVPRALLFSHGLDGDPATVAPGRCTDGRAHHAGHADGHLWRRREKSSLKNVSFWYKV